MALTNVQKVIDIASAASRVALAIQIFEKQGGTLSDAERQVLTSITDEEVDALSAVDARVRQGTPGPSGDDGGVW